MTPTQARFAALISSSLMLTSAIAQESTGVSLDAETINAADVEGLVAGSEGGEDREDPTVAEDETSQSGKPNPAIVKLQILLDRAGVSPGVIDGFDGDNVRKAIIALEHKHGLPTDGELDADVLSVLDTDEPVIGSYTITEEDAAAITGPVPEDYAEKAEKEFLGYASVEELVAERFHMDVDFLKSLNPGTAFAAGESVAVADYGKNLEGEVARIEADKQLRQVRAYDADGKLIAAYPATIGSEQNPSPEGTHEVRVVAQMPTYTYNPEINFQQGENTEVLEIPPGPNGPVGSVWIDLTEPTFGIHGTPEPSLIDKVGSHGCVRLTNWDAEELSAMVSEGVTVEFLGS